MTHTQPDMEKKAHETIVLRIHSVQSAGIPEGLNEAEEDSQELRFITEGEAWEDELGLHLQYTESEISGLEGTSTELVLKDCTVAVHRNGEYGTDFLFEMGKTSETVYSTPFGNIPLQAVPVRVAYQTDENGGFVQLEYHLLVQGEDIGMMSLDVTYAYS